MGEMTNEKEAFPVEQAYVADHAGELFNLFRFVQMMNQDEEPGRLTDIGYPEDEGLSVTDDMCFYKVERLSYDEDYPRREAFENVLNALDNEAYNFVYVLTGSESGVELCIGVVKNHRRNRKTLSTVNYGAIIGSAFEGNFNGSVLHKMNAEELREKLVQACRQYKTAGLIAGIPSINDTDDAQARDFQGIDRLINSMLGQNWRIAVVCEPTGKGEISDLRDKVYQLYNRLSVFSKMSIQRSTNQGENVSFGRNVSDSHGKNQNWNQSDAETEGRSDSDGTRNYGTSRQFGKGGGVSSDHGEGRNWSYSGNKGSSEAVTIEMANKHAQDLMQYIDEELLPRIKTGYGKGMFKTSLFYMADKVTTAHRLRMSIMSLFQGNRSTFGPLIAQELDLKDKISRKAIRSFQNGFYEDWRDYSPDAATLLSRPVDASFGLGISAYLTAGEASIFAGLPQREVPGIALDESVDFGLNEQKVDREQSIDLGVVVQKGRKLPIRFSLKKDAMMKHAFVAGVTGSGKTTTCHKLLAAASDLPFLVIEPSKTEYRTLASPQNREKFGDVHVFTLGNESVAPFRLNPFELVKGEVISAHIDMLKATFASAFQMEASMPQILEEAIIQCYKEKKWDLDTNSNTMFQDPFGEDRKKCFPRLSDLLRQMRVVVREKGFSDKMQGDYEGSLVSRLSNLTVGSKGKMLNCLYSVDFDFIADHKVVLEMEELKSPEDKSLLMGFILARLSAVVREKHRKNGKYKHLVLVEEAHRLLSKVDYGDGGSKRAAVEMFTDLLAEVRKYGEGLIVVDQIPNKLAPEVLKNTNTKIVHKILARDDKEAIGDTMLMDDKQKGYLSALHSGHAIVFTEDTPKPIHVYVKQATDTSEEEVKEEVIRERFQENKKKYKEGFWKVYEDMAKEECCDREIEEGYAAYADAYEAVKKMKTGETVFLEDLNAVLQRIGGQTGLTEREVLERFGKKRQEKTKIFRNLEDAEKIVEIFEWLLKEEAVTYENLERSWHDMLRP